MSKSSGENAIFILGLQRSGTTWIANMLAGSGGIAAVTAQDHRGVHESIFFSHFAKAFGPFSVESNRARFQKAFEMSDYYILTGLNRSFLEIAISQARDYEGVFEAVMQQVMQDQGCNLWLEKSPHHTLLAKELAIRFPKAKFICIVRNDKSLLMSRLAAYGRTPAQGLKRIADILRGTLANALYSRYLLEFASIHEQALLLNYDEFAAAQEQGRKKLTEFLELAISPEDLISQFAANTSHDRGKKTRAFSASDHIFLTLGRLLGRCLPISILQKIEIRRRNQKGIEWPEWVWQRSGWRP